MRKIIYFFVLLHLMQPFSIVAQSSAAKVLKEEQGKFFHQLNYVSIDSIIVHQLSHSVKIEVDSIYSFIISDNALPAAEKEKAILSLGYFMNELSKNIAQQRSEMYDIPGAIQSYKNILKALLYHRSINNLLIDLPPRRTQVLAATFSQYKEHGLLDDLAVYKRMASSPEFILSFLENEPGFRYADSLLLIAAAYDPLKIVLYLNQRKTELDDKIRNTKNIYLQQIISLAADRNASEVLPFVLAIAENRTTKEEILETRKDIVKYFQLLVNTTKESGEPEGPSFIFQKLLRKGLKEKSLSFYVNEMNELHSAPDGIRFASVKGLRPEDIYYIITSCGDELYTSSFLGLYKRLMENFKSQSADSLFSIVQYDNFRIFMRMAANYNVLTDFLNKMPEEKAAALINRFLSGIESDTNSGLEKAMDIGDSFIGLDSAVVISDMIQKELLANLNRCQSGQLFFGMRLYSILLQVFDLVKQKNSLNKLWTTLGNYDLLERKALQNKNGEIIQMVLFYGDEDGIASFKNFQKLFTDTTKWKTSRNENWVTVRSVSEQPIVIYANLPLDSKEELDIKAQDSLFIFLKQEAIEPVVLVHRGHSYHLDNTLKRLTPSVRLAILGSCGGSNSAISIASINPDAQLIVSKKTGSKSINDPIINIINETLLNREDLSWPIIWEKLSARFSNDEFTRNLFSEYIPPGKNVSLFVLKLFNFYNRAA
ncbi:MAG TPA: hypothetical protein VFU29_25000 [Chitinophagaceae bacterium]|nr:hypothetical protein [Chitinophagaceae bacterium]